MLNRDFSDLLAASAADDVRFLAVGRPQDLEDVKALERDES